MPEAKVSNKSLIAEEMSRPEPPAEGEALGQKTQDKQAPAVEEMPDDRAIEALKSDTYTMPADTSEEDP